MDKQKILTNGEGYSDEKNISTGRFKSYSDLTSADSLFLEQEPTKVQKFLDLRTKIYSQIPNLLALKPNCETESCQLNKDLF